MEEPLIAALRAQSGRPLRQGSQAVVEMAEGVSHAVRGGTLLRSHADHADVRRVMPSVRRLRKAEGMDNRTDACADFGRAVLEMPALPVAVEWIRLFVAARAVRSFMARTEWEERQTGHRDLSAADVVSAHAAVTGAVSALLRAHGE